MILGALQAITQKEADNSTPQLNNLELEASFHTLRRLLASKVGFAAFTNLPGYEILLVNPMHVWCMIILFIDFVKRLDKK